MSTWVCTSIASSVILELLKSTLQWTFFMYIMSLGKTYWTSYCPINKCVGKSLAITDSSVHFSHSVMSHSLQPHESQHTMPPCSSPTPGVYSNSCPLSWWCHPTISSSVLPFSFHFQSFPASGSFQMSQLFTSGGQSIGASASVSVLLWIFRTDIL